MITIQTPARGDGNVGVPIAGRRFRRPLFRGLIAFDLSYPEFATLAPGFIPSALRTSPSFAAFGSISPVLRICIIVRRGERSKKRFAQRSGYKGASPSAEGATD